MGVGVYGAADVGVRQHYLSVLRVQGVAAIELELRIAVRSVLTVEVDPTAGRSIRLQVLARIPDGLQRFLDEQFSAEARPPGAGPATAAFTRVLTP